MEWLDEADANCLRYGVVVGVLMYQEGTRQRTTKRLIKTWLDECCKVDSVEEAVKGGFEQEVAILTELLHVAANTSRASVLAPFIKEREPGRVMTEFLGSLPDRDKLLLSAYDSYLASCESGQDAVRDIVDDFDPANVPAEFQFLLGVKFAAEGILAA